MMVKGIAAVLGLCLCVPSVASARSLEQALEHLPPEFRSHQACILKGLSAVRREPRLRRADRMKTSIFSKAVLDGTKLTAKGGAVRSSGHWYSLSFHCDLTKDWMKAKTFSFELGKEIPEKDWEKLGLWR
jgi:hypothetical protein